MAKKKTLRHTRIRALSDMATVIEAVWGDRCSMNEASCACCAAWAVFDCMDKLTDSEFLDDHDEKGEIIK